ncbi:hypothetical protein MUA04_01975, partial [Enterobacteriaceae bacterium H11S18]|uniref:hypothetical protein n=1 Tax=Dryocola clanedunensis TaxID=2925396 RepID=UPI0022F0B6E2
MIFAGCSQRRKNHAFSFFVSNLRPLFRVALMFIWSLAVDELRSPSGPLLRNVQAAPVPLSESHKLAEYSKRKGP